MNCQPDDAKQQLDSSLVLFVTGDAPRSRRASHKLTETLDVCRLDIPAPRKINLLQEPQEAIRFEIFATPALMHIDESGRRRVLYGDLSDEHRLKEFLSAL